MRGIALFTLFTLLAVTAPASAWQKLGDWNAGASIGLELGVLSSRLETEADGLSESEFLAALSDWQKVECADIPASYESVSGAPAALGDGKNTISFIQTGWSSSGGEHRSSSLIGLTSFERAGGYIVEADIELNEENFHFVTRRGSLPEVNARSILLHELGHVFGLGHTDATGGAMHANYQRGLLLLGPDDIEGIASLFPASECAQCGDDDDCPYAHRCAESGCVRARLPSCVEEENCARDEYCAESSGNCIRGDVSPDFLGNLCEDELDCEEGILCRELGDERRCTIECDAMNTRSCPTGFFCDRDGSAACGVGYCAPGSSSGGALGTACEAHTDCGSLRCVGGLCALPCDSHEGCPGKLLCHPDRDDGCGACAPPLTLGERCFDNSACASELCVELEDGAICSAECANNDDCPPSLRCRGHEGVNLCLPQPAPAPKSGCGCSAADPTELSALLFTLFLMTFVALPILRRRTPYR